MTKWFKQKGYATSTVPVDDVTRTLGVVANSLLDNGSPLLMVSIAAVFTKINAVGEREIHIGGAIVNGVGSSRFNRVLADKLRHYADVLDAGADGDESPEAPS
jgi:hypothetical protein